MEEAIVRAELRPYWAILHVLQNPNQLNKRSLLSFIIMRYTAGFVIDPNIPA